MNLDNEPEGSRQVESKQQLRRMVDWAGVLRLRLWPSRSVPAGMLWCCRMQGPNGDALSLVLKRGFGPSSIWVFLCRVDRPSLDGQ